MTERMYLQIEALQTELEENMEAEEMQSCLAVLDAMNFFNSAWNSIDANAVINCFNKSGFCRKLSDSAVVEDTDESVTISKEWQQIAGTNATFSDYVDCDSSLFAFQQSSLKEILGQHQADANQEDNDDDGDKEQEALPIPTLTAAFEAMDTVRRYVCSFNIDEKLLIDEQGSTETLIQQVTSGRVTANDLQIKNKKYEELQQRITALTAEYDGSTRTMEQF
ncbi:conserved hypothetical protein [Trichinella spiralis]|uniref:hypothetical protein n=1 Tax=Trichinella spiralis TaxID=6334 RepID=UPI0001EFE3A9|nr:conserved hypothetical protein [Trichinella spiralis]